MLIQKVSLFLAFYDLAYAPLPFISCPCKLKKDKMVRNEGYFFFPLELKCKQDLISEQQKTHKDTGFNFRTTENPQMHHGVMPESQLTSTPRFRRCLTTLICPLEAAACRGVQPFLSLHVTSAPWLTSKATTSRWPVETKQQKTSLTFIGQFDNSFHLNYHHQLLLPPASCQAVYKKLLHGNYPTNIQGVCTMCQASCKCCGKKEDDSHVSLLFKEVDACLQINNVEVLPIRQNQRQKKITSNESNAFETNCHSSLKSLTMTIWFGKTNERKKDQLIRTAPDYC